MFPFRSRFGVDKSWMHTKAPFAGLIWCEFSLSVVRIWGLSCITETCPRVPVHDSSSQMSLASAWPDTLMSLQSAASLLELPHAWLKLWQVSGEPWKRKGSEGWREKAWMNLKYLRIVLQRQPTHISVLYLVDFKIEEAVFSLSFNIHYDSKVKGNKIF